MAVLVAALPGPRAAVAEVQVVQAIDYYDVTGTTAQEIRANMDRIGPTWTVDGKRYDSAVGWAFVWEYRFGPTARGCMMKAVTVKVRIITTDAATEGPTRRPRCRRRSRRSSPSCKNTTSTVPPSCLRRPKRIDDGIMGLPPQPNCLELKPLANHLADNVERDLGRLMHDYVRHTDAGRQLGAVFPPSDTKPAPALAAAPRGKSANAATPDAPAPKPKTERGNASGSGFFISRDGIA